jgi:cell division protein FtsL
MSSLAQAARVGDRPKRRASARTRPKQRLLGGGVLWIVVFGLLLAGVVAVNVAVLRLNLELDGASSERGQLKADIAGLRAELSSTSASARIERVAVDEIGLVQADPDTTIAVPLRNR